MCGHERIFLDMNTTVTSKVRMKNEITVQAKKKGTITVETKKEVKIYQWCIIGAWVRAKFAKYGTISTK